MMSEQFKQVRRISVSLAIVSSLLLSGCGGGPGQQHHEFFTSGSREADQRASQRMAKAEQLAGSGEGAGEKEGDAKDKAPGQPVQAEGKQSLYERLGGQKGISAIVEDFIPRVMQDPRVNWERTGVTTGGFFHKKPSTTWRATPDNVARLKQHMVQFLALATGGPTQYQGKQMVAAHAGMQITNPEFDAVIGDIKASLDNLRIANQEQKELLAIFESTRPQIATER